MRLRFAPKAPLDIRIHRDVPKLHTGTISVFNATLDEKARRDLNSTARCLALLAYCGGAN